MFDTVQTARAVVTMLYSTFGRYLEKFNWAVPAM
jgi:hypothetical protein